MFNVDQGLRQGRDLAPLNMFFTAVLLLRVAEKRLLADTGIMDTTL